MLNIIKKKKEGEIMHSWFMRGNWHNVSFQGRGHARALTWESIRKHQGPNARRCFSLKPREGRHPE